MSKRGRVYYLVPALFVGGGAIFDMIATGGWFVDYIGLAIAAILVWGVFAGWGET